MVFLTTASAAAFGVFASTLIKAWFDHYVSGASLIAAQQDDDLNAIVESTIDVRDRAIAYWKCCEKDLEDSCEAAAITGRIMFIGKVADELYESDANLLKTVQTELNRFDDNITRGKFMCKGRKAELGRLPEIEDCAYSLIYSVRRCRRRLKRHIVKA